MKRLLAFLFVMGTTSAIGVVYTTAAAIPVVLCDTNCSTPTPMLVNGQPVSWGNTTTISVYTDVVGSERDNVAAAIKQWNDAGSLPPMQLVSTADPGVGAVGFIRIVADSTATAFMQQLAPTSNLITSVTVSYNKSFQIQDSTGAYLNAYTPVINNGDQFFTNSIAHELGHALGLSDFIDPNTKNPSTPPSRP